MQYIAYHILLNEDFDNLPRVGARFLAESYDSFCNVFYLLVLMDGV